jgi:poly(3-hydroxybutyrate) depolymerase
MRIKFYFFYCSIVVLSLTSSLLAGAQTERLVADANINSNCNGYWEYLPQGYDPNGATVYPLFIYLPGVGEYGNGNTELTRLYNIGDGPPYFVHDQGVNLSSFTVNGTTYKVIILAPQWIRPMTSWSNYPSIDEINSVINYFIEHYKVDKARIYLTGISSGGGSVWHYAREASRYANRLGAIMPFSGTDTPRLARAQVLVDRKMPIWAFHNSADGGVSVYYTEGWKDSIIAVNGGTLYSPTPKFTIFQTTDPNNHVSWWDATKGIYEEDALNIYEWALQFSSTPAPNEAPIADAGPDLALASPNNSVQLQGSGSDFDNYTLTYSWSLVSGPGSYSISSTTVKNPTLSDLLPGKYVFRLTVSDGTLSGSNDVNVAVLPAGDFTTVQAENFVSMSGIGVVSTVDEGGGNAVGFINNGDWMDYTLNIASAGSYGMQLRVAAPASGAKLEIRNADSVVLATVDIPRTGDWELWTTVYTSVQFPVGTQNIRIKSISDEGFNINWFKYALVDQSSQSPLPVKFVYFNSQCKGFSGNRLEWRTAQEQNTVRFSVQKSTDGVNWTEVSTVAAAGQSTQERSYTFEDRTAAASTNLYRIVEYDMNGRTTISSIIRSNCSLVGSEINLYPNPSSGSSALNISLQQATKLTLRVVDSKGSVVQQRVVQLPAGSSTVPLNMSSYPNGVYTLDAQLGSERKTIKLIKK